ncbi:MAG: hypothetical protein ABIF85_03395 [Nanoarchaeota archaeon]|nr:hypothetical protein [Nanoarchaeota archaeon]MBU4300590.1 hypothetical protein [Nanoarchaeota archaeon]MBU4451736.1 hypothetical protein [Nanoarchaeota archaeon]MCG2723705.1 hypothetical protein [archaeon]
MQKASYFNNAVFVLLSAFLLFYYGMTYFQLGSGINPLFFAILAFLIVGFLFQSTGAIKIKHAPISGTSIIIAAILGAVVTFFLSTMFFGPVIAASIVGLAYAIYANRNERMKSLSGPVYCGAFVGMSSNMFGVPEIAFAGLVAGLVQTAPRKTYNGTGGTLGTIAFIATYLTSKIFGD